MKSNRRRNHSRIEGQAKCRDHLLASGSKQGLMAASFTIRGVGQSLYLVICLEVKRNFSS